MDLGRETQTEGETETEREKDTVRRGRVSCVFPMTICVWFDGWRVKSSEL